jgi:protein-S-isoprenylcysteine O-methyltransferase Ste14
MRALEFVFAVGWGVFWLYWLIAAFSMRRGRVPWSRELRIRAAIAVIVIALIRFGVFRGHSSNTDPVRAGLGLVLFAAGLVFAIWARVNIGRNWGMPMMRRDEPELVTSGPYRLVRHPIYTGILVAGVGTAVALSWLGLIVVALAGVYFVLQRDCRRALPGRTVPGHLPRLQTLNQDAASIHLLSIGASSDTASGSAEICR